MRIVEELATRLKSRSTIYYSQDDYNGILPSIESQRVALAPDDISLMWTLFDYASLSGATAADKPSTAPLTADATRGRFSVSSRDLPSPLTSSTDDSNKKTTKNLQENHLSDRLQESNALPSSTETTVFDPEAFSDLPEEWILDDWTLFGAPLSAYHYGLEP
jgi:hypothetical protein